ncbi:VarG family subclass B1-like metallo-beta-lactamase [Pseudoalteromonas shioyasakiensis]|uniref:VarG family subclass B1-like metallo-beta-lactamase n=1 Tax=Pseudoalteromonas shioyasakiensis TaxID=1190813 RepID=UPI002118B1DA|nr:VarG family subclass B1-like metallo-beta-lactamase [Pseudoalteromonas shioyasakiensis]MCQ8876616.1 VarG family subclass B1-like metallo-beta-lactamase [Pseudoalteromonas shioyasakiensis]
MKLSILALTPIAAALFTFNVSAKGHDHNNQRAILFPGETVQIEVEPSANQSLKIGQKINSLYERQFDDSKFTIQKLGKNTYWIGVNYYNATVVVSKDSVLLIDPLGDGRIDALFQGIQSITNKPISAIMYSHYHLDHVGGGNQLIDLIKKNNPKVDKVRVIASQAVTDKINHHAELDESGVRTPKVPAPNEVYDLKKPQIVRFGSIKLKMMAPKGSGHTPDNTMILIRNDRVLHFADMINPDQLPFYNFAGAEDFNGYETDLQNLLSKQFSKHWDFINGGHGNIGSKKDVKELLQYIADVRTEVGKQLEVAPYTPILRDGNHFIWFKRWQEEITNNVHTELANKYGHMYGFDSGAVETHAAMILADIIDH